MNLGEENESQEFKISLTQIDKGLKSLSAMLNRNGSGTVFFGVDDNGNIKGIDVGKNTLLNIRRSVADAIEPHVMVEINHRIDENGKSYISVYAEGADIPYSCDGRYYLRTASADDK